MPTLELKIISEENIKPSSPTPETQKHLKFSLLDQIALPVYVPLLLFYTNENEKSNSTNLKLSLSQALTHFYPLAGRVSENNDCISCNDEGAIYVEAQINCLLSDFLNPLKFDSLREFLPFQIGSTEAAKGCILLVQTTFFECGGMAIGLLMSHKISDASSISTFVKSWTAISRGSKLSEFQFPQYIGASVLPPPEDFSIPTPTSDSGIHAQGVTVRLVFEASKIAALKTKAASEKVKQPTRVESVTGLLWKCALNAASASRSSQFPSVVGQAVNLRKRLVPPVADSSIGNLLGFITPETMAGNKEIELQGLVSLLREAITEFKENGIKKYQDTKDYITYFKTLTDPDGPYAAEKKFYLCSSWSRFGFYEADFGWGCPIWFIGGISMFSDFFLLTDARDGVGIEALVTLSEEDMAVFQHDEDLLAFATLNPNIIPSFADLKNRADRQDVEFAVTCES